MISKELERKLKELKRLGMKDPGTKLEYKLMECEPATLTEISKRMKITRKNTMKIVTKLIKANILSVSCTKADKLMVKHRKSRQVKRNE